MAESFSASRVHHGVADGSHVGLPIANGHVSLVPETPPDILYLKFALTITVRWPPGVALEGDLAKSKAREVQGKGLPIHPRNICGLKTGAVLTFWETAKDHHAINIQKFLSKETTPEKMRDVNVISITFHDGCRIRLSSKAFQSSILGNGKTTTFRFGETGKVENPLLPGPSLASNTVLASRISNGPKMLDSLQSSSSAEEKKTPAGDAQKSSFTVVPRAPKPLQTLIQSLNSASVQRSPLSSFTHVSTAQKERNSHSSDGDSRLYQSSLDSDRPSQLPSHDSPISPSRVSVISEPYSHSSSSSVPQKRPKTFSDIEKDNVNAKKAKGEAYLSQSGSSALGHSSSFPASAVHQPPDVDAIRLTGTLSTLKAAEAALKEERESRRREKRRMKDAYDELKLEYERASDAEQAALRRKDELKDQIHDLRETLHHMKRDYEESMHRLLEMRAVLDDAESSKQTLRKTLQAVEEDCQKSHQREEELRAALHEAMHDLEKDRARYSNAEQTDPEAKSLAEEAKRIAEEKQKAAEEKQMIAEDALASERLRRIAAEQTFLDVKSIFSGVRTSAQPDSIVQADGEDG